MLHFTSVCRHGRMPPLADLLESKGIGKCRLSENSGIPWATPSDVFDGKTDRIDARREPWENCLGC